MVWVKEKRKRGVNIKVLSLVIKILILVAIIAVGVLIYSTCAGSPLIQRIDKTKPDESTAPYTVATQTKLYMAERATLNDDSSVTMSGWYEKDGSQWIFHEKEITLPPLLRPRIGKR